MYWLFKRYMLRMVLDFKKDFNTESVFKPNMRPDFYQLEQWLTNQFEWKDNGKAIVRRKK